MLQHYTNYGGHENTPIRRSSRDRSLADSLTSCPSGSHIMFAWDHISWWAAPSQWPSTVEILRWPLSLRHRITLVGDFNLRTSISLAETFLEHLPLETPTLSFFLFFLLHDAPSHNKSFSNLIQSSQCVWINTIMLTNSLFSLQVNTLDRSTQMYNIMYLWYVNYIWLGAIVI